MKTLKELKDFCNKFGIRYEICERLGDETYDFVNGTWYRPVLGYEIGMNNISGRKGFSEWSWTWFKTFTLPSEELTDDTHFWFDRRYSQMVGKTYKGWNEEFKAMHIIENRTK